MTAGESGANISSQLASVIFGFLETHFRLNYEKYGLERKLYIYRYYNDDRFKKIANEAILPDALILHCLPFLQDNVATFRNGEIDDRFSVLNLLLMGIKASNEELAAAF